MLSGPRNAVQDGRDRTVCLSRDSSGLKTLSNVTPTPVIRLTN